jgi:hypothetical protein
MYNKNTYLYDQLILFDLVSIVITSQIILIHSIYGMSDFYFHLISLTNKLFSHAMPRHTPLKEIYMHSRVLITHLKAHIFFKICQC